MVTELPILHNFSFLRQEHPPSNSLVPIDIDQYVVMEQAHQKCIPNRSCGERGGKTKEDAQVLNPEQEKNRRTVNTIEIGTQRC